MNVLTISYSDDAGGAARAAYRIHCAVKSVGVGSTMFVMNKQTGDPSVVAIGDLLPHGLLYRMWHWVRYKLENKLQHARWNRYPDRHKEFFMSDLRHDDIRCALKRMDISRFDVIHIHWINHRFFDLSVLSELNKPIVLTLHDSWFFCGVCHYFLDCEKYLSHCGDCPQLVSCREKDLAWTCFEKKRKAYDALLSTSATVVAPSRWLTECAAKSALLGRFRCETVPNCVDTDLFNIVEKTADDRSESAEEKRFERPFVLYGAVNAVTDKRKGFSNLLSALKILIEQDKIDFELVVFGANQPLQTLDESVPTRYVGYVSDEASLVKLYNDAAVMVVPSLTENLSCTIMESLSCGTPVVAFDIGGNSDMIIHKQNGYLAASQDNADLAAGIDWCLHQSWDRKAVRRTITSRFSSEIVAEKYVGLYDKIVRSSI